MSRLCPVCRRKAVNSKITHRYVTRGGARMVVRTWVHRCLSDAIQPAPDCTRLRTAEVDRRLGAWGVLQ